MSVYKIIINARINALITVPAGATPNNPPQWDSQPNPTFTNGTASNYSLADLTSDPDSDPVDVTLNTGSVSLPTGVTYNTTLDRLEYDGAGAAGSTTGHIATADDGTDTTDSNSFSILIQEATQTQAFPPIAIHHIGGRGQSSEWSDPTWQSSLAVAHELTVNFSAVDEDFVSARVAAIRTNNPSIRIHQYIDITSLRQGSAFDEETELVIKNDFTTPAMPGGTEVDGMSRRADETIVSSWPNKDDINQTDFPDEFNSQLPMVFAADRKYTSFFRGQNAGVFDDTYIDIWRSYPRFEDGTADWNRDGVENKDKASGRYGNFDETETINAAYIRAKEAVHTQLNTYSQADLGKDISIIGNSGSFVDYFDGAQAQNDVLISIPSEMKAITNGSLLENWGKINGYNPDGTSRAGSFERGYKAAQRLVTLLNESNGAKRVFAHIELQNPQYELKAYLFGVAIMAGAMVHLCSGSDHKSPEQLDEFFGQAASGLTDAQKVSNLGWMGFPIGDPPDFGAAFVADTNGGIVESGVRAQHYTDDGTSGGTDTALLLVNPDDNGNQTITVPAGSWKYMTGDQRAINDGSNVGSTISINAGQTIVLEPQ